LAVGKIVRKFFPVRQLLSKMQPGCSIFMSKNCSVYTLLKRGFMINDKKRADTIFSALQSPTRSHSL